MNKIFTKYLVFLLSMSAGDIALAVARDENAEKIICSSIQSNSSAFGRVRVDPYGRYLGFPEEDLIKRGRAGDEKANAVLALMLLDGEIKGTPQDALIYLNLALEKKDPLALYIDGALRRAGKYVPKDFGLAHKNFEMAANGGIPQAYSSMAADYLSGSGVDVNFSLAREFAEKAVSLGDENGNQHLGLIYSKGLGVDIDKKKGYEYSSAAARAGNSIAAWDVARDLYFGNGVKKDVTASYDWAKRAYCGGVNDAGLLIGINYILNSPYGNERAIGIGLLGKFAEINDGNACLVLSDVYLNKKYEMIDYRRGISMLRCAERSGIGSAKYRLGAVLLRFGKGKEDFFEAEKLLTSEALNENSDAQYDLGVAYLRGDELKKDVEKSKYWLEKSYKNGNLDAKKLLSESVFKGN